MRMEMKRETWMDKKIICGICKVKILFCNQHAAGQLTCGHYYCLTCISRWWHMRLACASEDDKDEVTTCPMGCKVQKLNRYVSMDQILDFFSKKK